MWLISIWAWNWSYLFDWLSSFKQQCYIEQNFWVNYAKVSRLGMILNMETDNETLNQLPWNELHFILKSIIFDRSVQKWNSWPTYFCSDGPYLLFNCITESRELSAKIESSLLRLRSILKKLEHGLGTTLKQTQEESSFPYKQAHRKLVANA